jgi:hypothetical protein
MERRFTARGIGALAIAPLAVVLAVGIDFLASRDGLSPAQELAAYSCLLTAYLVVEVLVLRAQGVELLWINPVVLATVLTFGLPYALTNLIFLDSGIFPEAPELYWTNKLMFLACLAASAMWAGYRSRTGRRLGQFLQRSRVLRGWLSPSAVVNSYAAVGFVLISLGGRLWMVHLGVYGYSSSIDRIYEMASYREYLSIMESLGRLALAALALQCFASSNSSVFQRAAVWLVVVYEVAFGLLSGFKSAAVMPFIIVGFVYYSRRSRFPIWLAPSIAASILAAYIVIEPFRTARYENSQFDGTSIASIADEMTFDTAVVGSESYLPYVTLQVLSRMNLAYVGSFGIKHASETPRQKDAPRFLENILLSPAHALVPRLLWPSKPLQNVGAWYNREVLGNDDYSSSGMGPLTYLNYAGGGLAVILGFLLVGVLQRGLFDGLRHHGTGGLFVFLGLLGTLGVISDTYNSFLVNVFRLLPMLIVAQYVLLHRTRPERATGN